MYLNVSVYVSEGPNGRGKGREGRRCFLYADRIESNPLIDRGHSEHVWQGCASNRDAVDTQKCDYSAMCYNMREDGGRSPGTDRERREIMKPYRSISRSVVITIKATSHRYPVVIEEQRVFQRWEGLFLPEILNPYYWKIGNEVFFSENM